MTTTVPGARPGDDTRKCHYTRSNGGEILLRHPSETKCSVLTNTTGRSKAKQDNITALSVVQQFDELMQHYGDGRDAHSML